MALETPIRYRRVLWNLCVDEDSRDLGFVEVLVDDDETLLLVSQDTFDLLSALNRLGDLFGWLVEPSAGERPIPAWMLTPQPDSWTEEPLVYDDRADMIRNAQLAEVDADYCVAAPHCRQDVIHRDLGFPICAVHYTLWGEVEALLAG